MRIAVSGVNSEGYDRKSEICVAMEAGRRADLQDDGISSSES